MLPPLAKLAAASLLVLLFGCVRLTGADELKLPEFIKEYSTTRRFSLGRPASIEITADGDAVLFLRSGPRSDVRDLFAFDVATGEERLLASAERLLGGGEEELTVEELARRERMRMTARGIASYSLSKDSRQVLLPLSGTLYVLDRQSGESRELPCDAGFPIDARFSPNGRWVASVREGDLYVQDSRTGELRRLTTGAGETLTHGLAEFVAQEEMGRMHGYWWSPDSSQLVFQQTDESMVELWHIADPANPAAAQTDWRYPRPGKRNAEVRLGIVGVAGGETTWITWDRDAYPYLADVVWEEDGPLCLVVQNREQTELRLLEADPATGETHELLAESDPAWINLDHGKPHWLPGGEQFLWTSERSGAWRLELRARDGKLVRVLTPEGFALSSVSGVDETAHEVIVEACPNPTEQRVYAISLDDSDATPRPLTEPSGVRWVTVGERSGVRAHDGRTLAGPLPISVFRANGEKAGELKSVAALPPFTPNVELVQLPGEQELHAAVIRPLDFQPDRRYPVIVSVYGGPQSQMVTADANRFLQPQWFAEQGFIVVSIDGRGTPKRGRDWERAIKGNLIQAPLNDQVRGLRALGERFDELDLSRVGVFGWSFGGYFSAMAVMQRPDVFHAAVAGAPVVDWRDYDTHYTERYMGLPDANSDGYAAASVLTHAPKLRRPLLLVHGTADDNVYFLHSAKLIDRLLRLGKRCDFLPLIGSTHMVADPDVSQSLSEQIIRYFRQHLQPRDGN